MSRNPFMEVNLGDVSVTPREGRVSRNLVQSCSPKISGHAPRGACE